MDHNIIYVKINVALL